MEGRRRCDGRTPGGNGILGVELTPLRRYQRQEQNIRRPNDRLSGSLWQTGSELGRQQEVMGPPATQPAANFDTSCGT